MSCVEAGSSYLAKKVDEKLHTYRSDVAARSELEQRVTALKVERPATANPAVFSYVQINASAISLHPRDWPTCHANGQAEKNGRPLSASCPGAGGSPTSREDYLVHRAPRVSEAALHRANVLERRDAHLERWYVEKVNFRDKTVARRNQLAMQRTLKLEGQLARERDECWCVLIALCTRLEAMRECLIDNRKSRALYERRKEAAVRIATWYKETLNERRHRYLIESCRRMRSFFAAAIARSKARVRRTCALRILDFVRREGNKSQISSAVQKLRRCAIVVQRSWRTRIAARKAQVALLTLQLTKLESRLLSYNRHKATGNNATVFAAATRRTVPLHEELRMTLTEAAGATHRRWNGVEASTRRRVKMDDEEEEMTPQRMLFLNTLTVRLPRWIKDQVTSVWLSLYECFLKVVQERLSEETRRFSHRWDSYVAEMKIYMTQKPIEEARIKLLRSAGIATEVQVQEPLRPHLRVIQSPGNLAAMLERGLRLLIKQQ